MAAGTGIEVAQVIPGFLERFEIRDLVACMAPRPLLLVSATADPYSVDADQIELAAGQEHVRFEGGHGLTAERVELITNWILERCSR